MSTKVTITILSFLLFIVLAVLSIGKTIIKENDVLLDQIEANTGAIQSEYPDSDQGVGRDTQYTIPYDNYQSDSEVYGGTADVDASATAQEPIKVADNLKPDSAKEPLSPTKPQDRQVENISQEKVFRSDIRNRFSFTYPSDWKVKESGSSDNLRIDILNSKEGDQSKILMVLKKAKSSCFEPVSSFLVDPAGGVDYRILKPSIDLLIEEKYRAVRTDEYHGTYSKAEPSGTTLEFLASNICIGTVSPLMLTFTTNSKEGSALITSIIGSLNI